jgi:hypothetical protein
MDSYEKEAERDRQENLDYHRLRLRVAWEEFRDDVDMAAGAAAEVGRAIWECAKALFYTGG